MSEGEWQEGGRETGDEVERRDDEGKRGRGGRGGGVERKDGKL